MNLGELILAARTRVDDISQAIAVQGVALGSDLKWSTAEWTAWANEAEREACRRARLIVDSTSEVTSLDLTAGEPTTPLDPRILFIRRAKWEGRSRPLQRISSRELDARCGDWEEETGEPRGYVPDMDDMLFRPYPMPDVDGTVRLTVVRLPLSPMNSDRNRPEIRAHLHESLLFWMLYRAYLKQDAEIKDEKKALENLAMFEAEFGKKSTAVDETWLQREHDFIEDEGNF